MNLRKVLVSIVSVALAYVTNPAMAKLALQKEPAGNALADKEENLSSGPTLGTADKSEVQSEYAYDEREFGPSGSYGNVLDQFMAAPEAPATPKTPEAKKEICASPNLSGDGNPVPCNQPANPRADFKLATGVTVLPGNQPGFITLCQNVMVTTPECQKEYADRMDAAKKAGVSREDASLRTGFALIRSHLNPTKPDDYMKQQLSFDNTCSENIETCREYPEADFIVAPSSPRP